MDYGSVAYSGGHARPGHVRQRRKNAIDATNSAPLRAHVRTVTFTNAVQASYSFTVTRDDGSTGAFVFTPSASATTLTLCAAEFAAFVNSTPEWSSLWSATAAVAVVTLTVRVKGKTHALSSATEATSASTVTALTPSALRPGRVVVRASTGVALSAQIGAAAIKHPEIADFAAMVATITIASIIATDIVTLYVETERGSFEVSQEFATDNATTATRLNAKLDAKLTALYGAGTGYSSSEAGAVITVVTDATEKGAWFSIRTSVSGAAATTGTAVVAYTTAESSASSLRKAIMGISNRDGATFDAAVAAETLAAYRPIAVEVDADVFVLSAETPTPGADVYVGTASGEEGRLYTTFATGRRKIAADRLQFVAADAGADIIPSSNAALARVNL